MRWTLALAAAIPLAAQTVRVYSEFARIGPDGDAPAPAPREILSPALVRNGFTSFQVAVQVKKGTPYWLFIGQNPENAVKIALYRDSGAKLEAVELPVPGDSTQVFWMDVFIVSAAPVRRIKIEPQLNVNGEWVVYPMEARVMEATVPSLPPAPSAFDGRCAAKFHAAEAGTISRDALHFRNVRQDAALASRLGADDLRKWTAVCDSSPAGDPEWYLHVRDALFRLR